MGAAMNRYDNHGRASKPWTSSNCRTNLHVYNNMHAHTAACGRGDVMIKIVIAFRHVDDDRKTISVLVYLHRLRLNDRFGMDWHSR